MCNKFESLAEVVKNARKRIGISQRELSRRTGIDNNTIAQIERGNRKKPNILSLKKIVSALGLDLRNLMMLCGYSLKDIEVAIDPEEQNFYTNEIMIRALFSQYFKENDITKTEWFKNFDKETQKAIKSAIEEYMNRY